MKDKRNNKIENSADTDTSMLGDVTKSPATGSEEISEHTSSNDVGTSATTKIEWNRDMEYSIIQGIGDGEKSKYLIKGRCRKCWGKLMGRTDDNHVFTGIKCRVCGAILEGNEAKEEAERMSNETGTNMFNMIFGLYPEYATGQFVEKIFPCMDRQTEDEIKKRVNAKVREGNIEGKLTRNCFPSGSAGFLYLQAVLLMAGVGETSDPLEMLSTQFPWPDLKDDGSAAVYLPMEELGKDPQYLEFGTVKMLGSTMARAMLSAFACELTMKAICLTCKDEALKDHDLLDLYEDLPESSRKRIEADFTEIREVINRGRHTFGAWRYFEKNLGEKAMGKVIDMEQAQALGKAARVILDEAEMVGLGFNVSMKVKQNVRKTEEKSNYNYNFKLNVKGWEAPPA